MVRTRVGYAGGSKANPTYHDLGDHSETIQVDYDPQQISYTQLLDAFWQGSVPIVPSYMRQYASLILYHNEAQRKLAEESKTREEARTGKKMYTDILPLGTFTLAEDYHQKHSLRGVPGVMEEYEAIYPRLEDLLRSTAVARANGYVVGYGSLAQLEQELSQLGLSEQAQRAVRSSFGR